MLTRARGPWDAPRAAEPGPSPPARVEGDRVRATFINHSTVLLQMEGLNILTDPIWSERCGPLGRFGPRRVRPPGLRFEDLPPIDLVLLSHNHYDHCDLPTLRRLARRDAPRVIAAEGMAAPLARAGIAGTRDLAWWESKKLPGGVTVTATPARHWSGRGLLDRAASHWCGYMIEGAASGRVYFAGDTGFGAHFEAIRDRLGAPRLALIPIGAYLPRWFMAPVHLSPREAIEAHRRVGAHSSLAIHFGTFPLADDGERQALEELDAARAATGVGADEFWTLDFGEGRDAP